MIAEGGARQFGAVSVADAIVRGDKVVVGGIASRVLFISWYVPASAAMMRSVLSMIALKMGDDGMLRTTILMICAILPFFYVQSTPYLQMKCEVILLPAACVSFTVGLVGPVFPRRSEVPEPTSYPRTAVQ